MNLPAWLHSHLNTRDPLTPAPGQRVDAWNIAHWTPEGLNILAGAHDRSIAERVRDEYTDVPGVFVVRGGTPAERGGQR